MEELISGYCRTQDAARMVLCEEDGGVWEADSHPGVTRFL